MNSQQNFANETTLKSSIELMYTCSLQDREEDRIVETIADILDILINI
jgi:hypothetical protein